MTDEKPTLRLALAGVDFARVEAAFAAFGEAMKDAKMNVVVIDSLPAYSRLDKIPRLDFSEEVYITKDKEEAPTRGTTMYQHRNRPSNNHPRRQLK